MSAASVDPGSSLPTIAIRARGDRKSPRRDGVCCGPCDDVLVSDPASDVKRYHEAVADLGSSVDALLALLHPTVRITEPSNAITPHGGCWRPRCGSGGLAGLTAQMIDIHAAAEATAAV
jgi:hypothetical protein